ncbi:hypothetical protein L218DRAFT_837765, partial [Marasmius fiardii PR-910]
YLLSVGMINVSEAEIMGNLNHAETVATLLALFQTGWLIGELSTRGWCGLYISELEVLTLGFAVLNLLTYIVWWDKPQR